MVAESIDLTKKWREQVKPKPNRSSADSFSQPQPVKVTLSPCRLCSHLLPSCPTTPLPRPPAWTGLQVTATSLNSIEISYPQVEAGHIIQRSLATQRSPRKHTHMQGTHQQTSQANARCSCSAAGAGWLGAARRHSNLMHVIKHICKLTSLPLAGGCKLIAYIQPP